MSRYSSNRAMSYLAWQIARPIGRAVGEEISARQRQRDRVAAQAKHARRVARIDLEVQAKHRFDVALRQVRAMTTELNEIAANPGREGSVARVAEIKAQAPALNAELTAAAHEFERICPDGRTSTDRMIDAAINRARTSR